MIPPAALISSAAIISESRTVCSEIAMAPEVEFRKPSLTLSPLVSTQVSAPAPAESSSSVFEPQAVRAMAATITVAAAAWMRECLVFNVGPLECPGLPGSARDTEGAGTKSGTAL